MFKSSLKKLLPGLLLGVCCNAYGAPDLIPELFSQGMKNYTEKKYSAASDYLGQVVDMDGEHSQARYYLVYSLALSGNNELALKHASILANKFPNDEQYKTLVNQIKAEINRNIAKKKHQEAASGKIQKEVVFGGYQSLDKNATLSKPREDYTPRDIKPPKPLSELEKAIRKIDEEAYDEAESMLKDLAKKEPKNAEIQHNLGVIDFSQGLYKKAIGYFQKALELDPKSFQSQFLIADCYKNINDFSNAEKALKKATEIKDDEFALLNLAEVSIELGKFDEAEKIYEKVLAKSPNSSDASTGLASIRIAQGKLTEALEMVNSVLSKGNSSEANYVKGLIFLANGLNSEAVEEINKALISNPNNPKYLLAKARAEIKSYDFNMGIDHASVVLNQNPDSIPARLLLAEAFIETSAESEAEAQLEEIEKRGKVGEAYKLRGDIARKRNDMESAKSNYEKFFQMAGGLPVNAFEYASILDAIDQKKEVEEIYNQIIKTFPDSTYAEKAKEQLGKFKPQTEETNNANSGSEAPKSNNKLRTGKVAF